MSPCARVWLVVLALAVAGAALPTGAGEPTDWAYELSSDMMSPFCPGRTLTECPSQQADELRMWLLVQAAAGRTRADVEAELLERYGNVILAAPRAEGFGVTAYVFPVVAFFAGGLLLWLFLRRQTRAAPEPLADAPLDPELERLVDRELAGEDLHKTG